MRHNGTIQNQYSKCDCCYVYLNGNGKPAAVLFMQNTYKLIYLHTTTTAEEKKKKERERKLGTKANVAEQQLPKS